MSRVESFEMHTTIVEGCRAESLGAPGSASGASGGGALFAEDVGAIWISKTQMLQNKASDMGGGLFLSSDQPGSARISFSAFASSRAARGGAMFIQGPVDLSMENTTIKGNEAKTGGGVSIYIDLYGLRSNSVGVREKRCIYESLIMRFQVE